MRFACMKESDAHWRHCLSIDARVMLCTFFWDVGGTLSRRGCSDYFAHGAIRRRNLSIQRQSNPSAHTHTHTRWRRKTVLIHVQEVFHIVLVLIKLILNFIADKGGLYLLFLLLLKQILEFQCLAEVFNYNEFLVNTVNL